MFIAFEDHDFHPATLKTIEKANEIIDEYTAQGFSLTLRQLYYQFVARDLIPNTQQSYKRLGNAISKARLAGLVSWQAIEDRTRNRRGNSHWDEPADIIESAIQSYHRDLWENQETRVEVWIEKDALVGVIEKVCKKNDVYYIACRGYMSQSEQFSAARRYKGYAEAGQQTVIIHLGDHDPSGIDMTRDNQDRLDLLSSHCGVIVERIALNYDQVEYYNPPPNPTKLTDSRAGGYVSRFGHESWELDALEPKVIVNLIQDKIDEYKDPDLWDEAVDQQESERNEISGARELVACGLLKNEDAVAKVVDMMEDGFFDE